MNKTCHITGELPNALLASTIIAQGLVNPRGLQVLDDGSILLAEAGAGLPSAESGGRVIKLAPDSPAQSYRLEQTLLAEQQSMNMRQMMKRDEIMGLSDIATGNEQILVSLTDYVGGSKILQVSPLPVKTVFNSKGNLNSIVYHPQHQSWFGIKPDANVVVAFSADGQERIVARFDKLTDGQDAVPVCVVYEPQTGDLLVSLFSGEIGQNPAKVGVDFDKTAGQVVRVNIQTGLVTPVITGLTAPTGISLSDDGVLYVLELCNDFLEPLVGEDATQQCLHGGFKRFSGRLLAINLATEQVTVVAKELDTPSNITIANNCLLVSEGMGMPGRSIPDKNGNAIPIDGYIRQLNL